MLYICIFSNKFDLKQTIRVLHNRHFVACFNVTKCLVIMTTVVSCQNSKFKLHRKAKAAACTINMLQL